MMTIGGAHGSLNGNTAHLETDLHSWALHAEFVVTGTECLAAPRSPMDKVDGGFRHRLAFAFVDVLNSEP